MAALSLVAYACSTETVTTAPSPTAPDATVGPADDQSKGPVAAPVRRPASGDFIYFVMTDRFENGDPSNDTGGIEGGALDHGYLPEDTGYYHGGDLAGLTARLDYLAGLGVDAIWMTPPFTNRWVQGNGTIEGSSAGYHGYWQTNFDQIDPHLGTEAEMQALIAAAHEMGISIYFDIVINHTGDVINYTDGSYVYFSQDAAPYLSADGTPFLLEEVTGEFPRSTPLPRSLTSPVLLAKPTPRPSRPNGSTMSRSITTGATPPSRERAPSWVTSSVSTTSSPNTPGWSRG